MRYVRRPPKARLIDDPDVGLSETADTIFEADGAVPTGLLDAEGNMIYRRRDPIGFGRRET